MNSDATELRKTQDNTGHVNLPSSYVRINLALIGVHNEGQLPVGMRNFLSAGLRIYAQRIPDVVVALRQPFDVELRLLGPHARLGSCQGFCRINCIYWRRVRYRRIDEGCCGIRRRLNLKKYLWETFNFEFLQSSMKSQL